MREKLGIYIHIPFCERKCYYCGFLSFCERGEKEQEEYISFLLKELEINGREISSRYLCDSVFIGGGTPSILKEGSIPRVLEKVHTSLSLSSDAEISIEGNPNSLTRTKLNEYKRSGVNRLSIGVQAFDDHILEKLGRVHKRHDALRAYEEARDAGFDNINLDLMFGVPDQSFSSWSQDLRQVLDLCPDHLSLYTIQLEEGSSYYEEYRKGTLDFPSEQEDRKMFHYGAEQLRDTGYEHYEISNFGKKKCRHNLKYWSLEDYLGVGLGSSSYLGGSRGRNVREMNRWQEMISRGRKPLDGDGLYQEPREETISIYCFTALRKKTGISLEDFAHRFGVQFDAYFMDKWPVLRKYEKEGLLRLSEKHLALTEAGIDVSNEIMAEFI